MIIGTCKIKNKCLSDTTRVSINSKEDKKITNLFGIHFHVLDVSADTCTCEAIDKSFTINLPHKFIVDFVPFFYEDGYIVSSEYSQEEKEKWMREIQDAEIINDIQKQIELLQNKHPEFEKRDREKEFVFSNYVKKLLENNTESE